MKFEFSLWLPVFLILLGFSLYHIVKSAERDKKTLTLLRGIILILIIFVFLQPVLVKMDKKYKKSTLGVLVDISKSMDIKKPFHKYSVIKDILKNELKSLKKEYNLVYFTFAGSIQRTSLRDCLEIPRLNGEITDIGSALEQAKEELLKENTSTETGLVLITDGAHNGFLDPFEVSRTIGIPVYVIGVGPLQAGYDLEVMNVLASDIAFRNIETSVTAKVKGINCTGKTIKVILKKEKDIIAERFIKIKEEGKEEEIKFTFTPKETGLWKYSVVIPGESNEVNKENNVKEFNLQVLKEKVRILYLSGCPNFDYRFLRQVVKTNPNYEVVSFIILRNSRNILFFPENELTLIPFPATELFAKEIFNFDIVIFDNFSYMEFFSPDLLNNISVFVEKYGGAFIMIGGDNSFGKGGYKGTAVENILPVEISAFDEKFADNQFKLKVIDHPVNLLAETKEENDALWNELPELEGCNVFIRAKQGAVVLGSNPNLKDVDGSNMPVITIWQKGRGRVLAVGTNTTWKWSMGLAASGRGNFYYSRYWQQMINWMINTPELKQVRVITDKKSYTKGEIIRIITTVLNDYYLYEDNAVVDIELTGPNGKKLTFNNIPYVGNGTYECSIIGEEIGRYTIVARGNKGNKNIGKDSIITDVSSLTREDNDIFLNEKLLKDIAVNSSGSYFRYDKIYEFKIPLKKVSESVVLQSKTVIWDSPFIFVLIVVLLTIDWYIRRISGIL